jgi:hypothetical protein
MSGHVIYESRLELTRLLYADFDRGTDAVLAQPFLLSAQVDGRKCRHVPDFLILRRGTVPLVVDVKPRHLLARPKVSFSLGWAREAVESRGWEFEAWCEPPEAELANVRFLAGYRRAWLLDPELLAEIRGAGLDGATLGEAFGAFPSRPAELVRAGVLHLLWAQHLVTDLGTPLSARHRLRAGVPAEARGAGTRELPRPAADSGDRETQEDGKAGSSGRGAYMGQAGVRVGVGTRFAYDGEVVTVVEMSPRRLATNCSCGTGGTAGTRGTTLPPAWPACTPQTGSSARPLLDLPPPYDRSPARPRTRVPPAPGRARGPRPRVHPHSPRPRTHPECAAAHGRGPWPACFSCPHQGCVGEAATFSLPQAAESSTCLLTPRTKRN